MWRKGMAALAAAGPHVYVKISMLCYTDSNWDKPGSRVPALVKEVLDMFGAGRFVSGDGGGGGADVVMCKCSLAHALGINQLHVCKQLSCGQGVGVSAGAAGRRL